MLLHLCNYLYAQTSIDAPFDYYLQVTTKSSLISYFFIMTLIRFDCLQIVTLQLQTLFANDFTHEEFTKKKNVRRLDEEKLALEASKKLTNLNIIMV